MEHRLEISTSLELRLTPSLYQNIQLLQLPILTLETFIRDEVESNPLIEVEETVWEQVDFPIERDEEFDILSLQPSIPSLRERLISQARLELEGHLLKAAELIIDNLNRSGYLELGEDRIAETLGIGTEEVKRVREVIKRLEPVGCGCYSLKESFKVQLEELGFPKKFTEAVEKIELLRRSRKRFLEETGFKEEELEEFLKAIRLLNPEPGNVESRAVMVVPDVEVFLEDGELRVKLNVPEQFRFRVRNDYLRYATTQELKKFLTEKYQRAINLKRAIEQRNRTLKAVTEAVFRHQIQFLKDGKSVKPLLYRDIAERLSIHESTVSRAVKEKFVQTPFGVYPFKHFFRRPVSGTSRDKVKEEIRRIIEGEKSPLSDGKIARLLSERGIRVARRTVAKYREEMGIPNAIERRRG